MEDGSSDPFASACAMLRALRDHAVSTTELLAAHLGRIERHNPALNAIVTPSYDDTRTEAADADRARARGEDRPLLGLPLTIKDCIDVAGLPGAAGVTAFATRRPAADARVVARLCAAGAIVIGKTTVSPLAEDWQADNPVFGRTNSPWDRTRTPVGSVRIPAAFCGIYADPLRRARR